MRNYIIVFTGIIFFSLLIYFTIIGMETSQYRRFLYYYPNGYIANTDWQNSHVTGRNIRDGERLPPIRLLKNSQSEDFSFDLDSKWETIFDFLPHLLLSLLYILIATWFLFRDGDGFLSLFFLTIGIFIFSDFILLAFNGMYFTFYFCLYLIFFLLIHLGLRFKGKNISSKWLVSEIFFTAIFAFIGNAEQDNPQVFNKLSNIGVILVLMAAVFCMLAIVLDVVRYKPNQQVKIKKWSLVLGFLAITIVPYLIFQFQLFEKIPHIKLVILGGFLAFPFLFIYGTYRYSFIPEQLYFNSSILILYLTIVVIMFYSMTMGFFYYISPEVYSKNKYIINILFLIFTLSTLTGIKFRIASILDYWTFGRNHKLNQALEEMAGSIASPISMRATMSSLTKKVREALSISHLTILIPDNEYPSFDLKSINMLKIPGNSEIWKYFASSKEAIITSYFAYGIGIRESVFKFLKNLEIQLAFPMFGTPDRRKVSAVFLVGEKINKSNFSLGELRFIKECTRLSDLLLQNYQLLINEVEKKKLVRDLSTIQILDRTINPSQMERQDFLELGYLSIPAVGISGDYIDFINISKNEVMIFLGDVSGHGLGSGYLVSAVKALTRNLVFSGMDLRRIFHHINEFLLERYQGSEFMSLIGGIYEDDSRNFEFINAGHLPLLIQNTHGTIIKEDFTHRLLGVLPCEYELRNIQLNSDDRLVLYSDGVTETFGPSDILYGEQRLRDFLTNNLETPIKELPILLEQELQDFRRGNDMTDDISFIVLSKS